MWQRRMHAPDPSEMRVEKNVARTSLGSGVRPSCKYAAIAFDLWSIGGSASPAPAPAPGPGLSAAASKDNDVATPPTRPARIRMIISTPRTDVKISRVQQAASMRSLRVTAISSLMNRLKQRTASDLCVVRTVFRAEVSPGTGGEGLDRDGDVRRHLRLGYHRLLLLLCSPRRKRETSRISNEQQHAQKITESFQASELQGEVMVGGHHRSMKAESWWGRSHLGGIGCASLVSGRGRRSALRCWRSPPPRPPRSPPTPARHHVSTKLHQTEARLVVPRHQPIGQTQTMHRPSSRSMLTGHASEQQHARGWT